MPSHLKFECLVEAPDPTLAWWAIGCIQPIYTSVYNHKSVLKSIGTVSSYNQKVNQNLIVSGVAASLSMGIFLTTSRRKYPWKQTPGQ